MKGRDRGKSFGRGKSPKGKSSKDGLLVFCAPDSSFEECQVVCSCNGPQAYERNKENDDVKEIENLLAENNTDDDIKVIEDILAACETSWSTHAPDGTEAFQDVQQDMETELEAQEK